MRTYISVITGLIVGILIIIGAVQFAQWVATLIPNGEWNGFITVAWYIIAFIFGGGTVLSLSIAFGMLASMIVDCCIRKFNK